VSSIHQAEAADLAFCAWEGEKGANAIARSQAGIILCKKSLRGVKSDSQLVFLDNPRLAFVHFVNRIKGDHPAKARAVIGDNCRIGELAVIGDNCVIGNNVVIEDRVSLKNVRIGDGCTIQSGASIGSDGFAYERHPDGRLERFPHLGMVVLGKNVEVSANCSIARGSLGDTVIGDGTKLDALVHVAHNVQIGKGCQLAAGTIIGGSTTVGGSCWTGLNSTLKNQIHVGESVLVAAGACVIGDVPDGDIVAGVPARSIRHKVKTDELFIMTGRKEPAALSH
jgi:UDP-3-O-[3-hydroxymyristoyl] glucosamine N-acyltransferase